MKDEMSVWQLSVGLAIMFILGMLTAFAIDNEDCQMFGQFKSFGTVYKCEVKQ